MKICVNCRQSFSSTGWRCPSCGKSPGKANGFYSFAPSLAKMNKGFKPEYYEDLFDIAGKNFWFRSRNRLLIWALKDFFPHASSYLEIGCGMGYVLSGVENALPSLKVFGSEIYSEGLKYAKKRVKRAELFQMDARDIPFEDEFDAIAAFDILEHIPDDEKVLSQMYRACRKGGGILLAVPQHPFLWSRFDEHSCHVRRYTSRELRAKVERAGFKTVRTTSFISLLLPLFAASRLTIRRRAEYDIIEGLKVNSFLNSALEKACDIENALIRSGLSFPAGASLLLAARKE